MHLICLPNKTTCGSISSEYAPKLSFIVTGSTDSLSLSLSAANLASCSTSVSFSRATVIRILSLSAAKLASRSSSRATLTLSLSADNLLRLQIAQLHFHSNVLHLYLVIRSLRPLISLQVLIKPKAFFSCVYCFHH